MAGGAIVDLGATIVVECWAEIEAAGCLGSPSQSVGLVDHDSGSCWMQGVRIEIEFSDDSFISRDTWVGTKRAKEVKLNFGEGNKFVP